MTLDSNKTGTGQADMPRREESTSARKVVQAGTVDDAAIDRLVARAEGAPSRVSRTRVSTRSSPRSPGIFAATLSPGPPGNWR